MIRDTHIKDLISKIELILPDVVGASQDLSTLRTLFEEQLTDAAALRLKSVSSYQHVRISGGLEKRLRFGSARPNYTPQRLQNYEKDIKRKYPDCGFKLGYFLYAAACPQRKETLKHNQAKASLPKKIAGPRFWPVRLFFRIVRFVES